MANETKLIPAVELFAFDNATVRSGETRRSKSKCVRRWRILSEKTNASPRSHSRALLPVTVVHGARNMFTTDSNRGECMGRN